MSFATTAPGAGPTREPLNAVPELAFVIAFSLLEPERVGEVGFVLGSRPWLLGRGGKGTNYVPFARQRPGEPIPLDGAEVGLDGASFSRLQAEVAIVKGRLEIRNHGQECPMFINGVRMALATVSHGDRVHFENEIVLLVVLRPKMIAALRENIAIQPFGCADAAGIVGEGPAVWALRDAIALAAAMDDHTFIWGQSGTGKELAAYAIHKRSRRTAGPFVAVNAGVNTESLNQANIFGNEKNFPNPGMAARVGQFPAADGGSLFLDEVGDCPREVQIALLRAINSGEYQVLGDPIARVANVRVIAATNRDDGLRSDFFARIPRQVLLPPLRERREDIPLLIRHLVIAYAQERASYGRFLEERPSGELYPRISPRLVDYLLGLPFETNVRELRNLVRRAVDESDKDAKTVAMLVGASLRQLTMLAPTSSPPTPSSPSSTEKGAPSVARRDLTKEEILAALERNWWSVKATAKELGVPKPTLNRWMVRYGIERPKQ